MRTDIDMADLAERIRILVSHLDVDSVSMPEMRVSAAATADEDLPALLSLLERNVEAAAQGAAVARAQRDALIDAMRLVSEAVVLADVDGRILHQDDLTHWWLEGRVGGSMAGEALREVLRAASSGHRSARSLELLGPPRRSMMISGVPVVDAHGEPAGAVAVVEDTTEQRHLETARRDFVANVSHELKTPIGALGLLAETLIVEKEPAVMERLIHRMHVETIRVGQVIDDLLNLSRIESLRHVSAELVSAKGVVDQAISRVRYAAEHRSIAIDIHGDLETTLYGGQRELVSAVHHLLENALKYSNENSSVEVGIHADGDWTEISIRDHGMGIAEQYLDRIFERFYRVDDARTRSTGGTGLGLSIVRHVVQSHGGEVRVASQEGDGSTFTLRLAARPSVATERLVVEGGTDG